MSKRIYTSNGVQYLKIYHPEWIYELAADFVIKTRIRLYRDVDLPYIHISRYGVITFKKGYRWNGGSGPAINTKSFVRGSLVHDGLYQVIGLGLIPDIWRLAADMLLRDLCRGKKGDEHRMFWLRSRWVYYGVRWFGWRYC